MCGICGLYGVENREFIERMLSVLKHRGPDGNGIYTDNNISMGHARLSIIDLSEKGKQPMSNENGDVWLVVNGEIYNFIELRSILQKKGHIFHSSSDSEVIVHAYEEYGLDFIKYIRGMFALALYDTDKKRLILARDSIGKKPLYYSLNEGILAFASEIKAILKVHNSHKTDEAALWSYLAFQYSIGDKTLFHGIKKILPGTMAIIEENQILFQTFWNITENITDISEQFAITKLRQLLEESVRLRMISDVPVGAFLSGGIDSSAIVALAQPFADETFHTFSVGFETYSELNYASIVSNHLNTEHHELKIGGFDVIKNLKRIAWIYDEPLGDTGIISNYFISHEAKKFVKVVLAGEGGDEIFGGYPNYQYNSKMFKILRPGFINNALKVILNKIPINYVNFGCYDPSRLARYFRYAKIFSDDTFERIHLNTTRQMMDDEIRSLTTLQSQNINNSAIFVNGISNPLNKMLAVDCKNLLPEKFLMKADKGTMANSIEERAPLLDIDIIHFAFNLPPYLKIKDNTEKYLLRKAVSNLLPKEIINRPKMGFGTPMESWMKNELQELVIQTIEEGILLNRIMKSGLKCQSEEMIKKGIKNNPSKIWTLFALELWYDLYFTNWKENHYLT
jgi:asparagine synthase (glutamine-hydrolysing)